MTEPRSFTVEDANRALPILRRLIGTAQERMAWLAAHPPRVDMLVEKFRIPDETPVPADYLGRLLEARQALGEIQTLGVQVKDIRVGLVDFPARIGGREVLLCWKLGEESVAWYHDPESGFAGRRPIPAGGSDPPGGAH